MIRATVLHPGYIHEAMVAATASERYADLIGQVQDWSLPEDVRRAALAGLDVLKLEAWGAAGAKYRRALRAYEFHTMMRRPGTAIEYVEPPRPPIPLDFTWPPA